MQIENRTVSRNGTTYTQAERQPAALDGVNRNELELSAGIRQIDERMGADGATVPRAALACVGMPKTTPSAWCHVCP